MNGMLSHLTVVEIAQDVGVYTGRLLGQLGAKVIKAVPASEDTAALAWRVANADKQILVLDPATGRAQIEALLKTADILIQGGGDGLAEAGLGFGALSAVNPALISVIVAPFAEDGPMAGQPATDLTLMALSGIMHMVGDPDRSPLKLPGDQAYQLAGIQGVTAALTALHARRADGRGQRVWVSAYQSAVLAGYRDPIVWEWTGRIGQRTGNRLVRGKSGVRQVWQAKDGYVTWSLVDNPAMVKGVVGLMTADGQAGSLAGVDWDNTLLADAPQEQIDAWEEELAAWFAAKSRDFLVEASGRLGLGLSRIDTPEDAQASEHWGARKFWRPLADPAGGPATLVPGAMFQTSRGDAPDPVPARLIEKA
jgi:crotonobetainyl-CoA:carnitine CoA-transferase CaiB-like acyl-CoA transferase